MLRVILLTLIFAVNSSESYKILLVFPVPARSHYILGSVLAKGLASVGHDVTIVSPYREAYAPKKGSYREIVLSGFLEEGNESKVDVFKFSEKSLYGKINTLITFGEHVIKTLFSDKNFRKLLHSNETFDATIIEQFIVDSLKGLPAHFKSHQILLGTIGSSAAVDSLVGNPSLPSFAPDVLGLFPVKMNFWERLGNTIATVLFKLIQHFYVIPVQNCVVKKYLPNAADLNDEIYNVSLLLLNSHPSLNHAQNRVPNMVDVAGFHLQTPKKLPNDLQEYLDKSKNGVVYFSTGSIAKSKNMPVETRILILRSLGNLTEDVLWKWEEDDLPLQPKNVRIEKWLPQESILAHPNVKLFITHGGFLSTIESINYGVPMVVIPVFVDQKLNAKQIEESGLGRFICFQELEEKKFMEIIKEVLTDPKYKENTMVKSALMKDREVPPLETAIYWVEYIIRHKGARHLRVAALDLSWYQYYLLDVIGFIILVLVLLLFIINIVISWLFCKCRKYLMRKVKIS